ncbi:uncharacterized protein F5147DRAFT_841227 [Suillus discolor]|uniref:Uncharacterized protein n=1 Tax=Suillus discolor TaxID=1912936 RepID=A0A9P7JML8_9AGAM|nr:uncharacterized protein F5147DRAFT_841227 [Suillus discolor]KAG2088925.1 hypothetical protein F5147DRAFT_841227 [Suillus discolor]
MTGMTGTVLTDGEDEPRVVRPVHKIKPTAALLQHSEKAALPSQIKAITDFRAAEAAKRASECLPHPTNVCPDDALDDALDDDESGDMERENARVNPKHARRKCKSPPCCLFPSFGSSHGFWPALAHGLGLKYATLGEQLESVFGWKARTSGDGVIPILERGKAICALHGILMLYYEKYPTNNVLKKWVHDITAGAEKVYEMYGVPIPECSKEPVRQQGTKRPAPDVTITHSQSTGSKQISNVYQPKSSGAGRNPIDIMSRLVIKYHDEDSQKNSWGCVASGCTFLRQGNAQLERALKHATTCKILQADHVELWRQAIQESDIDGIADSDDEDGAEDELLESEIDGRQPAQAVAFEIHPDIDINSKALKDMVSTDPVSVVSTVDLSFVLSPQAATMVTDDGDADWNY